jgi:hypothetical protein
VNARCIKLFFPKLGVVCFSLRELQKKVFANRIGFCRSQRRVQRGAVEFVPKVVLIALDVRELTHSIPQKKYGPFVS